MLPESLESDFYSGRRSDALKFCINDDVEVTRGSYAGRRGVIVALDRRELEPRFLVEFGDGTDELLAQSEVTLSRAE